MNRPNGYCIKLRIEGSETLPSPLDSYIYYIKWTESREEPPGWAQIDEYFLDKSCKIIDDKNNKLVISES